MRVFAILLLILLAALAIPAQAQDAIHHCVDAHGNPVFTDQPCAAMQATPVQTPARATSAASPDMPVPLEHCAATPAGLRQRVIDAFAARDPNQLAGLMLWSGYGNRAVVGDLRALNQLVRQPLLDIHFGSDDGPATAASAPSEPANPDELRVRTNGENGSQTARFAIIRRAGCLWLGHAN